MYLSFFGFREPPFSLTPDPQFLYLNASYQEALAGLRYGIVERKGFVSLIGEAGTGKTTLLRRLLTELGPGVRSVLVLNPAVEFEELLAFILSDLGQAPPAGTPKLALLQMLNAELLDTLARGENVVVLIDEAQDLGIAVLEELRLLSNLETAKEKILQIVLAGQPELDAMLSRSELRQLRQRIAVPARLRPLGRREIAAYVAARVEAAGGDARGLFTKAALWRLWRFSRGVPRLINVACDNVLLSAYAAGVRRVGWKTMGETVRDLRQTVRPLPALGRRLWPATVAAGVTAILVAALAFGLTGGRMARDVAGDPVAGTPQAAPVAPPAEIGIGAPMREDPVASAATPDVEVMARAGVPADDPAAQVPGDDRFAASDASALPTAPLAAPDVVPAAPPPAPPDLGEEGAPVTDPDPRAAGVAPLTPAEEAELARALALEIESEGADPSQLVDPAALDEFAPAATTIEVVPGDTLSAISLRHYGRVSSQLVDAIRRANPLLGNPNHIQPGETLVLPPDPFALEVPEALLDSAGDASRPASR